MEGAKFSDEPSHSSKVWTALLLTFIGAAGTALGGLMVIAQPDMSFRRLGILQGVAAGLMLCISFVDLLPAALAEVGFVRANVWFFAGAAFFAAIVAFIPEPSASHVFVADDEAMPKEGAKGVAAYGKEEKRRRREVMFSGLVTALGIALHNFPEGVAVFLASMKSQAVGLSLALAIALHNIPEGVAVALPVYFATKSRWTGFKYAALSGFAEPLAVVVLGVLLPVDISHDVVEQVMAGVAGIMAFLTLHELMPLSLEHAGRHAAIASLFAGMALMAANLYLLDHWIGGGGH